MLTAAVVRLLPLRVDDGSLADFHDAVTRREPDLAGGVNQFDVRPLVAMVVNVIRNLRQQDALILQQPMGFLEEGRERMRERVLVFLRRPEDKSEPSTEVLLVILSLIWDVRRVVHQ